MATMGMVIVATAGEATAGMVMDLGGLTVEAMGMVGAVMVGAVVVGIRAPESMSVPVMATTLIPINALPQGTAGIHAPIMAMSIRPAVTAASLPEGAA
jgi:hypothetical protein